MGVTISGQIPIPSVGLGEVVLYVTPTARGLANGISWENSCTLRTALAKATGDSQTTIFLGAGVHDTDNGVDATGTEIDKDYVRLIGFGTGNEIGQVSRIANKAASATHSLRVTGNYFVVETVSFVTDTDTSVIHLSLIGGGSIVKYCLFMGTVDTVSGVVINNGSSLHTVEGCRFERILGSAVTIDEASAVYLNSNVYASCATALYASHANAGNVISKDNIYTFCTTAINIATAIANRWTFLRENFSNCTTNFTDAGDYGPDVFFGAGTIESNRGANTYPTGTGVSVNTGNGIWAWTAAPTTIIPADTIAKPIKIKAIHPQNWTAAQIYKIEILYGETVANISAGIYEFSLGDPAAKGRSAAQVDMNFHIPPMAIVGVKIASSTDGVDNLVMTFGYEPL